MIAALRPFTARAEESNKIEEQRKYAAALFDFTLRKMILQTVKAVCDTITDTIAHTMLKFVHKGGREMPPLYRIIKQGRVQ